MAHNITFSPDAGAVYLYCQSEDNRTLKRINKLLQVLQRDGVVQELGKREIMRGKRACANRAAKSPPDLGWLRAPLWSELGSAALGSARRWNITGHLL